MEFQIREGKTDDASAIYELNKNELGYEYDAEKTRKRLAQILISSHDKIIVAVVQNVVVGYVHAVDYDVLYAPPMKDILGIAVSNKYKRHGIGKSLLCAVENWAKDTGACGVRLVTGETRTEAHAFYRHCGYSSNKMQLNFNKMFYEMDEL